MALEVLIQTVSEKTAKAVLVVVASILTVVGAYAVTLETNWQQRVSTQVEKHEIDIRTLALSTENLRQSVDQLAQRKSQEQEEKNRRLDRLLDILERQAYNTPKGGK